MSTFHKLLGNHAMLLGLLEGFMHDAPGEFDILINDENLGSLRFSGNRPRSALCKKISNAPAGKDLCGECELQLSKKAALEKQTEYELCKSALASFAVPVIGDNTCLAIILWSQFRKASEYTLGLEIVKHLERSLGFESNSLVQEYESIPIVTDIQFKKIKGLLIRAARYIEFQSSQTQRLEAVQTELNRRIEETKAIQEIVGTLMEVVDVEVFWLRLDTALEHICRTIEALYAVFFVSTDTGKDIFETRAVAFLPRDVFINKHYPSSDPILREISTTGKYKIIDFDPSIENSICKEIDTFSKSKVTHVALIPLDISASEDAIMTFFIDSSISSENSLDTSQELPILSQAASQIATAYLNSLHHTDRKRMAKEQNAWFEDVSHQLIAPLNGLQASAERLVLHYDSWDHEKITNQLRGIRGISKWAARLARNFDWEVRTGRIVREMTGLRWVKLRPFLIGCAIDLQGLAALKRIRIHVHESIQENWYINVNQERFYQAVENILDNAVKYSSEDTEVKIKGEIGKQNVFVSIINYGIPLTVEEISKIFDRGFRTEIAKAQVVVGTGIGLPIAQEIVQRHGGAIIVNPSTPTENKHIHKVVFSISLPLSILRRRPS